MLKGVPALMPPKLLFVKATDCAVATATVAAATMNLMNCILKFWKSVEDTN